METNISTVLNTLKCVNLSYLDGANGVSPSITRDEEAASRFFKSQRISENRRHTMYMTGEEHAIPKQEITDEMYLELVRKDNHIKDLAKKVEESKDTASNLFVVMMYVIMFTVIILSYTIPGAPPTPVEEDNVEERHALIASLKENTVRTAERLHMECSKFHALPIKTSEDMAHIAREKKLVSM